MRVLLVSEWPQQKGGVETYLRLLRRGLEEAGDEVRLLVSSAGQGREEADYVARVPRHGGLEGLTQVVNPIAAADVRRAVRDFAPHVAHVSMFELHLSPSVFGALRPVPAVANVTWYKPICPTGHKLLPDGELCRVRMGRACVANGCIGRVRLVRDVVRHGRVRAALAHASSVVVASRWMADVLASEGIVAQAVGRPVVPGRPAAPPAGPPLFACVGRLSREKGVDVALRALARLRDGGVDARLRIVGSGPDRPRLEGLAADLGLGAHVDLVGSLPHEEVGREIARAWAVVMPSLWEEPYGNVALEAIGVGVPVVASRVGGLPEIVEDGRSGTLVPRADPEALAAALSALVARPARIAPEVVAAARQRHSLAAHVERVRRVFETVRVAP
jgi:glycosyltransferase involved in cell wall biosynthesis